jgi:hypothetical protein
MRNISIYNPIAKMILNEHSSLILENEKVDSLISKISDNALNCFKVVNFDLAPKRERNPNVMRDKLSSISSSKSVKTLTSKLIDYSENSELANSKYHEVKGEYISALKKFCKALVRTSELSKDKESEILKRFKIPPANLQNALDSIAERAKDERKKLEESLSFLNESHIGFNTRLEFIKKTLVNLLSSAEGKNQKNGYGRDWKRIFLELDEKRRVLDRPEVGYSERGKKSLEDLEKQVHKFSEEFNNALVQTVNKAIQNIEDDDEVIKIYSDVTELTHRALDDLTRAKAQQSIVFKEILDDFDNKEATASKSIFPLSLGDKDSDKKICGTRLISNIQKALSSIPSASDVISNEGGINGVYNTALKAVVSTIQKVEGNKNTNGEIDKTLLDSILASDWVSNEDKKKIQKSIENILDRVNESLNVLSFDDVVSPIGINENRIVIKNSEFSKELSVQYAKALEDAPKDYKNSDYRKGEVYQLSKSLRKAYKTSIEDEDFIREDGDLKSAYSPEFISAWNLALASIEDPEDYSYFYFNEGLYSISSEKTSLKTPCNWPKWKKDRKIEESDNEDLIDFLNNYLNSWKTFGMIKPEYRYTKIRKLISENLEREELKYSEAYTKMKSSIRYKDVPFVDYQDLKTDIKEAFESMIHKNRREMDLDREEFVGLNNFIVSIANSVTFDGDKFISCLKWIHDNVLGERTCKKIASEAFTSTEQTDRETGNLLTFEENSLGILPYKNILKNMDIKRIDKDCPDSLSGFRSIINLNSSDSPILKILARNLGYITSTLYPSIETHLKRINSDSFNKIPNVSPFKCFDAEEK